MIRTRERQPLPTVGSSASYNTLSEFERRNLEQKLELIRDLGWDINQGDRHGDTLLHYAVRRNDASFVEAVLCHKDIDVDKINHAGLTPLLFAAKMNRTEVYKLLLRAGASPFYADLTDFTVLDYAATNANTELVCFTLDFLAFQRMKRADLPRRTAVAALSLNCFPDFAKRRQLAEYSEAICQLIASTSDNHIHFLITLLYTDPRVFKAILKRPEVKSAFTTHPSRLVTELVKTAKYKSYKHKLWQMNLLERDLDTILNSPDFDFDYTIAEHKLITHRLAHQAALNLLQSGAVKCCDTVALYRDAYLTENAEVIAVLDAQQAQLVDPISGNSIFLMAAEENLPIIFEAYDCGDLSTLQRCLLRAAELKHAKVIQVLADKHRIFQTPGLMELACQRTPFHEDAVELIVRNTDNVPIEECKMLFSKLMSAKKFGRIMPLLASMADEHRNVREADMPELKRFLVIQAFQHEADLRIPELTELNNLRKALVSSAGVDVNITFANGLMLLHNAIRMGDYYGVKILLSSETVDVNATDAQGVTPLYLACSGNQLQVVKALLAKGADKSRLTSSQIQFLKAQCSKDILRLIN